MAQYDPRVELCFDKGADPADPSGWTWTDITNDIIGPVSYSAGRQDESSRATESKIRFTLLNDSGKYTPDLATSPYYGKLDYGVPVRVTDTTLANTSSVAFAGDFNSSQITTPDTAALDIVGDLDIRADIEPDCWFAGAWLDAPVAMHILAKYNTGSSQRSYMLNINYQGKIELVWSSDNVDRHVVQSSVSVPIVNGRLAIRATLDVNNGASGHTVTFYTAPTIDGTWTQLGSAQVVAGVTSIYSSTSKLSFGMLDGSDVTEFTNTSQFVGKVYALQVRNGINGTIVANPDFRPLRGPARGLTDSAGLVWTIQFGGYVTDPSTRAWGYISEMSVEWPAGDIEDIGSGGHSIATIGAAGLFTRLDKAGRPLNSPMYRAITLNEPPPTAYWPCEDEVQSTRFASAVEGVDPAISYPQRFYTATPEVSDFANYGDFISSAPVVTAKNASFIGTMPVYTDVGRISANALIHIDSTEASSLTADARLMQVDLSGSLRNAFVDIERTTGNLRIQLENQDGTVAYSGIYYAFNMLGKKFLFRIYLAQVGADVFWQYETAIEGGGGGQVSGTVSGKTIGRCTRVSVNTLGSVDKMDFGHVSVFTDIDAFNSFWAGRQTYMSAYDGEEAALRFARLTLEEGVPFRLRGAFQDTAAMGPQGIDTLANILQECAEADNALLYESRETEALEFRTRADMYDQVPVVLDADSAAGGDILNPFQPVKDDSKAANDVTAKRKAGSSLRITDDADIAKRGTYKVEVTKNVANDEQLSDIAGDELLRGTTPGMRYPQVSPGLDVNPAIRESYAKLRLGDKLKVTNLPVQHPNPYVELISQGYDASTIPYSTQTTLNTSNALPWNPAEFGEPWNHDPDAPVRADTVGSVLTSSVTSGSTTLSVRTTAGPPWARYDLFPVDFPMDINIAGEQIRVSQIADRIYDDYSRTVSNGWGSNPQGDAYSFSGGSASDYSVSSNTARILIPDATRSTWLNIACGSSFQEPDFSGRVLAPAVATTDVYVAGLIMGTTTSHYKFNLLFNTNGTVDAYIADEGNIIGTLWVTNMRYSANTWFNIRARIVGTTISMKAWKDGDTEPTIWQKTIIDSSRSNTGSIGFTTVRQVTNSNTNMTVQFDDLRLASHQTFTVSRSINNVSKAHSANESVALWATPYVAR